MIIIYKSNSQGKYEEAIAKHEQHLTIAREIGDRQGEGAALGNLGNAYNSLGKYNVRSYKKKSAKKSRKIEVNY